MARKLDLNRTGKQFTRNWFLTRNYPTFVEYILPRFAGKPTIYLELGCFEGMSLCWMFQHVLTHPDSKAVGIDPWLMTSKMDEEQMEAVMERATDNLIAVMLKKLPKEPVPRCIIKRSNSAEALTRMNGRKGFLGIGPRSVDLCMIDGNHHAGAVYDDARLVLPLMKTGGWMLFDDVENDKPKTDHVREGIDWFLARHGNGRVKEAWRHRYCVCYEVL